METSISLFKKTLLICVGLVFFVWLAAVGRSDSDGVSQVLAATPVEPTAPPPERALAAYEFVNSIGLNTHLNYFDRTYGNFPLVERDLRSIGIHHLRDGIHLQNSDYNILLYSRWAELSKLGIHFDAVLDPRSKLPPLTAGLLEQIDLLAGHTIESFEGPNELDISGMPDWISADRGYQSSIAKAVRSMPDSGRIALIGPSLASASNGTKLGIYDNSVEEGNLHSYPAAKIPSAVFPSQTDLAQTMFEMRKVVVTESGYHNALNDHSDQPAVSEQAAAKYIPRLFLEDFARGIPRTYLYEFMDEAPDPGLTSNQMHWGLIRADGSEKPAFIAVKRLIEELSDGAVPAQMHELAWSLDPANSSIHHLLLQKSNGEFDLILWQEISSFDSSSQRDIANPTAAAMLTLGHQARSITLYEPSMQDGPVKSFSGTASVPISIPDHPLVIAITPE